MIPVQQLVAEWRQRAELVRTYAADERAAKLWEMAAVELEQAIRAGQAELLTLSEAAAESGYSADHLARLLREGTIPNAGRTHAPRIRRGDVPAKPGKARARARGGHGVGSDRRLEEFAALAIRSRMG